METKIRIRTGFIALIVVVLGITSCQKDDFKPSEQFQPPENYPDEGGSIVLGKQLENPYSIKNMRIAYQNLKESSSGRIAEDVVLGATHLYVRFLPDSHTQLTELENDTTLILFDYPLDYEFAELGDYYHDPSIPDSLPTWQYTAVNLDFEFPNIRFEILDSAYIPLYSGEEAESVSGRFSTLDIEFLELLEEEAFAVCGYSSANARNCSDYKPKGKIQVDGTALRGVEVKCQNFLKFGNDFTDSNGDYFIDKKFSRSSRRTVEFSRYEFDIHDGWISKAQYVRGEECGDWSVNFAPDSKYAYYSHIFRAAFHYYYQDILGLRRPPENGVFNLKMDIRAHSGTNTSAVGRHTAAQRFLGSQIEIWTLSKTPSYTYGTTIHELAHASHWAMDRSNYNDGQEIVVESWANGVEWALSSMVYPNYSDAVTSIGKYTQVVVDMVDAPAPINPATGNPVNQNQGSENLTQDNVQGYTIRQIEDALKGQKNWTGWRDNIKDKYINGTEINMDVLFAYWD